MDDVARSRRLLLSVAIAVAGVACGGGEAAPVGVSPPRAAERAQPRGDASAGPPGLPGDFRARLSRLSDRFLSQGHAERFDAVVWANDAARQTGSGDSRADSGSDFADGAMFVEEAIDRAAADGGVAGLLTMEKRAGAWRFSAIEPDGQVLTEPRTAACAACHREAPRDFAFRTPPPQSSSAAASAPITATAPTPVATAAATYDARSAGSAAAPSRR